MTDQPARIGLDEITAFLDQVRGITPDTPLAEQIAFFDRKADLLTRIAARLGTAEAYRVAADARQYARTLARRPGQEVTP